VTLVQLVQAGDRTAFEVLYRRYIDQAVRVAFLITHSQQLAEDVAQETFVQVLRRIRTLREPRNFRPWFYSILHNAGRRTGRKEKGWSFFPFDLLGRGEGDTGAAGVDELVLDRQEVEELRTLITRLPEHHREVIVLRYYAELTEPEMAEALNVPAGTVKSRLHGARQRLLAMLQEGRNGGRRGHFAAR